ncbi:MAG: type II secretion system F family protein [Lachnospiraceae bacterium]|nr:type II secretion system F family protein [Lachnospiraceae bacterium]
MSVQKKLSNTEISSFCDQTALILSAGITPVEGMRILLSDTKDAQGRKIISDILEVCEHGEAFSKALAKTGVFPDYAVNMVAVGEESGKTDEVMRALSDYYAREEMVADNLKSAVRYPLIMIGMMLIVILVLITKVLPIFNQVFIQLGSEITGFSRSLLQLGSSIRNYSIVFIIVLAVLVLIVLFAAKTRHGRKLTRRLLAKFLLTRSFFDSVAAGRFANGMALTLSSGLDTYQSLDMVAQLVDHQGMAGKIANCKSFIEGGDNFSEAVAKAGIFSNLHAKMIAVGFRTGNVDVVMSKIAEKYEKETNDRIYSIIAVLEPTLVIILSLIVGLILLSVILPLMGIMTSIG